MTELSANFLTNEWTTGATAGHTVTPERESRLPMYMKELPTDFLTNE